MSSFPKCTLEQWRVLQAIVQYGGFAQAARITSYNVCYTKLLRLDILSRLLLAQIFIIAGFGKLGGYTGTQSYMEAMGVPGVLLPLVIILELGGGIALLLGYRTKIVALLLAGFCLLTAVFFHNFLTDPSQMVMFMKNLA